MKIHFAIPPFQQRIGGLDKAIIDLSELLKKQGDVQLTLDENTFPDQQPDIVHFHGLWQTQHRSIYQQCIQKNFPYIISPHGMLEPYAWKHKWWKKKAYFELIERKHFKQAAAILSTSKLEKNSILKIHEHPNIQSISLGYNTPITANHTEARLKIGANPTKTTLIYLSRIDPKKGLAVLFKALTQIDRDSVELFIVGDGDKKYIQSLKEFIQKNETQLPKIYWAGPIWDEKKWDYLAAADLFCLPTQSENFGIAVLEAALCGTAILTSPETPWGEFKNNQGFNICKSTPPEVSKTLTTFLNNKMYSRDELKNWAKKHFLWENLATQYVTFYQGILRDRT